MVEGVHSKTCAECYHWFRLPEENTGECFRNPPRVFKVTQLRVNPLTREREQNEGLVSHFPITGVNCRACGEFKPNLAEVKRKETAS